MSLCVSFLLQARNACKSNHRGMLLPSPDAPSIMMLTFEKMPRMPEYFCCTACRNEDTTTKLCMYMHAGCVDMARPKQAA
eukprot:6011614-Karenia_brevis.AAC.1